jgi:2-polyprenyl-3-methyl-5-hydroxy-6-metoxy-1,4-benzoquinol methylase
MSLRASEAYFTERASERLAHPFLPDPARLRDRRLLALFHDPIALAPGADVLEIGCGRSPWLPHLARAGYRVTGIEREASAAELARANLQGAGVPGSIRWGDGFRTVGHPDLLGRFDLVFSMGLLEHFVDAPARLAALRRYLKPGGRILTTVPNLHGVNWLLQWLGGRDRLERHVGHDARTLVRDHEHAAFETVAWGYVGFCDGYLSGRGRSAGPRRRALHRHMCRALGLSCEAWLRAGRGLGTPESRWLAPHLYYVGRRAN